MAIVFSATYNIWMPRVTIAYLLFEIRNAPEVSTPVPKTFVKTLPSLYETYTMDNIRIGVPWKEGTIRANENDLLAVIFEDQAGIILSPEYISHLTEDPEISSLLGVKTNYELYTRMLDIRRKDISILALPRDSIPKIILLTLRSVIGVDGPVYSFTNKNGIRGFEFKRSATSTITTFFTPNDVAYSLVINNATQEKVDAILQSIDSH